MRQTQSAGPVRTAHMSVLLTVNIVSHNPAQSSYDNLTSPDKHHSSDVVYRRRGCKTESWYTLNHQRIQLNNSRSTVHATSSGEILYPGIYDRRQQRYTGDEQHRPVNHKALPVIYTKYTQC